MIAVDWESIPILPDPESFDIGDQLPIGGQVELDAFAIDGRLAVCRHAASLRVAQVVDGHCLALTDRGTCDACSCGALVEARAVIASGTCPLSFWPV